MTCHGNTSVNLIVNHPEDVFVADLIGKANFLPAQVVGVAAGGLDLNMLGRQLSIHPPDSPPCVGADATLLGRPEATVVDVNSEGYPGRVSRLAYLGPVVEYEIVVPGEALVLTQYDQDEVYPVGTEGHVLLVKEALYLLPKG
jgi:iron(III) transport system ATP-binding protein